MNDRYPHVLLVRSSDGGSSNRARVRLRGARFRAHVVRRPALTVSGVDRLHLVPARRWRHYATRSGRQPTREYLQGLDADDYARVLSVMRVIELHGLQAARHLRGDIYEARTGGRNQFRLIFATEGRHSQILLALDAFAKKTRRTPGWHLRIAEERLRDWRTRRTS